MDSSRGFGMSRYNGRFRLAGLRETQLRSYGHTFSGSLLRGGHRNGPLRAEFISPLRELPRASRVGPGDDGASKGAGRESKNIEACLLHSPFDYAGAMSILWTDELSRAHGLWSGSVLFALLAVGTPIAPSLGQACPIEPLRVGRCFLEKGCSSRSGGQCRCTPGVEVAAGFEEIADAGIALQLERQHAAPG
jgi:hypothetical protein